MYVEDGLDTLGRLYLGDLEGSVALAIGLEKNLQKPKPRRALCHKRKKKTFKNGRERKELSNQPATLITAYRVFATRRKRHQGKKEGQLAGHVNGIYLSTYACSTVIPSFQVTFYPICSAVFFKQVCPRSVKTRGGLSFNRGGGGVLAVVFTLLLINRSDLLGETNSSRSRAK